MAKQDKRKEQPSNLDTEVVEEMTNTAVEVAPVVTKIIMPEDMDATMKLVTPVPVKKVQPPVVTTGEKAIVKTSGCKEIVGKEGDIVEIRGDHSVVLVGGNKYLVANNSLEKV